MSNERYRWTESDHGEWICECGEELILFDWCYETCPGCGRTYKMGPKADTVTEKSEER